MRFFALLALAMAGAPMAIAQSAAGFGSISGSVRDASGAAVPNAKIVVHPGGCLGRGNVTNSQVDTSLTFTAFTLRGGILSPTQAFGVGRASAGFPDGTNARRAQVSDRFLF